MKLYVVKVKFDEDDSFETVCNLLNEKSAYKLAEKIVEKDPIAITKVVTIDLED